MKTNFLILARKNHQRQDETIQKLIEAYHVFDDLAPIKQMAATSAMHSAYWHGVCHGIEMIEKQNARIPKDSTN